jgi:uncharacterized protein YndB with AHSA1/START domain
VIADESLIVTTVIDAPIERVFGVLADPTKHAGIDGTGWVCEPVDSEPLTRAGQLFRMAMYHPNHPDGNYQTVNQIEIFEPPNAIAWKTGYETEDGELRFAGWFWRYDLTAKGPSRTEVTLSYDWSAVSDSVRELIGFPMFPVEHLDDSLAHLAELVRS